MHPRFAWRGEEKHVPETSSLRGEKQTRGFTSGEGENKIRDYPITMQVTERSRIRGNGEEKRARKEVSE